MQTSENTEKNEPKMNPKIIIIYLKTKKENETNYQNLYVRLSLACIIAIHIYIYNLSVLRVRNIPT